MLKQFPRRTAAKRLFADAEMGILVIDECNALSAEEFIAATSKCKGMVGIHGPGQNMRPADWRPEASETDKVNAADMLGCSGAIRPDFAICV